MDSKLVNKSPTPFVDPKCHTTVQNAPKPAFTNQQLIPIYTQFCNRYLLKQQLPTIHDLTYEIREPRKLVQLIHAVTFGCSGTSQSALFCSLNAGDPVDQIERCLQYLAGLGVNVSNCCAKDLHSGHLGEILALIFALSHYKQQQKSLSNLITASPQHVPRFVSDRVGHAQIAQLNSTTQVTGQRESKLAKMSATKLRRPLGSTSSLADTSSSTPVKSSIPASKLLAPTRRVSSNANPTATSLSQEPVKLIQVRVPSAPPASNRLKPPTTTTKLQRPTPQSVNKSKIIPPTPNVTSLASSTTSSTSSAASFSSTLATTSGATLTKSQLKPPKSLRPPSVTRKSGSKSEAQFENQIEKVITNTTQTPQKTEAPASSTPPPSKMLKLFGKSRKTPETVKDESTAEPKILAPAKIRGLKPPTNTNSSGLLAPTTTIEKTNVNSHKTELRVPSARTGNEELKRTSKSSEEDSGFGNSTAVSLNSSNSSLASGSNGVRQQSVPPLSHPETIEEVESIAEDSGICSDATTMTKHNAQSSNSPQLGCRKPTLAVKAITAPTKRSLSSEKPSRLKTMIDTNAIRTESNQQTQPSLTPATQSMDEEKKSLKKPTVPVRKTSRLRSAESENLDEIPDPMPQLRISTTMDEEKLRNVPASAESISNDTAYINIRKPTESANFKNEEFALDFGSKLNKMPKIKQLGKPPPSSPKTIEMHRTMRMNCRRRDYIADSCEDSSSISSGISDNNFEDVSTDDLTGSSLSDHQMTAASYGEYRKAGVEIGRPRTSAGISSATSNLSILEPQRLHQRRMVEQQQNVVEELLQKSRTSQRSVAFTPNTGSSSEYERVYHTVHGPSNASPNRFGPSNSTQLLLSQDGQTLSISRPSARPSLRTLANQYPQAYQAANHHASAVNSQQSNNYNTHSLDRHAHLKQFVNPNSELIYDSLSGQVPYRISTSKPSSQHSSIYAAASEYSIGHSPTARHQYTGYDMLGQQRRSNVTSRGSQLRSSSLSSANASSLMSRSMILYESDSNLSSPVEPNNNPDATQTPRQRLISEMMAAIKARTPPRSRRTPLFSLANNSSNSSLSARLPNNNEFGLNLHKLSGELSSPRTHLRMSTTNGTLANGGSQLSLTSSLGSAYSTSEDAYENLIRRLNDEMSSCRTKLKTVDKDDLQSIIHVFDNKLEVLVKQVEKLQKKSAKTNDVENLMSQIEDLRRLSINARLAVSGQQSGRSHSIEASTDGMKRQPSVESVNSCYTSTKGGKEKGSASGFGRNSKKGWIRSSFTRAFHKGKKSKNGSISECEQSPLHRSNLKTIAGSTTTLDSNDDHLVVLKKQLQETEKQLQETEKQLGNFQLEALDKAREVDILQNTVNRLKNENKFLKHTTIMLERKAMRSESRASSRQSLTCCHEEDGFYEQTPSIAERSCSSTSSSKRSSGGLNARVVVNIDVSGALTFTQNAQELNIGSIPLPSAQTSWTDVDTLLGALVEEYMRRVDPEMKLQLSNGDACIIGYQLPDGQMRDRLSGKAPTQQPSELITPTSLIRLKLCGSAQNSMDSLCLESLFPKEILQKLLNLLLASHRLVINGSTGIGKSGLARYLGRYLAAQRGISTNQIKNIMFPNDESDQRFVQVQQELETLLKSSEESIILIDNIHRRRVELICEAFAAADEYYASNLNESASVNPARGPFVIITLNRTSDLQLQQMQITYNVRAFSLYCQLEPIKGFLGRYLRRRIAQDEFTGNCRCGDQLQCVIEFLSRTLEAVNNFIKDLNALDTIGPRIFLQCPLSMEASREWFIQLWNSNIVVYMARIVRDSNSTIEWKDPTQYVAEIWPWLDGVGGESVLHTVSFELDKPSSRNSSSTSSVGGIDVLNELDRIAESNRVYQSNKYSSQQLQVRP